MNNLENQLLLDEPVAISETQCYQQSNGVTIVYAPNAEDYVQTSRMAVR